VPFGACGLDVPRFPEDAAAAALDNLKHLTALAEWVAASISRNRRSLAPCSLPGCNRAASTFRAQLHLFYAEPRLPGSGAHPWGRTPRPRHCLRAFGISSMRITL
jgi:hypothetical protein